MQLMLAKLSIFSFGILPISMIASRSFWSGMNYRPCPRCGQGATGCEASTEDKDQQREAWISEARPTALRARLQSKNRGAPRGGNDGLMGSVGDRTIRLSGLPSSHSPWKSSVSTISTHSHRTTTTTDYDDIFSFASLTTITLCSNRECSRSLEISWFRRDDEQCSAAVLRSYSFNAYQLNIDVRRDPAFFSGLRTVLLDLLGAEVNNLCRRRPRPEPNGPILLQRLRVGLVYRRLGIEQRD